MHRGCTGSGGRRGLAEAAFDTYLQDGSPYVVSHYAPDVLDAVRLVRDADGVPVWRTPFAAVRGLAVTDERIEQMARAGLVGVEVHHRDHTREEVAHGEELARGRGLLVTGSSDYHGNGKPNRLGEHVTESRFSRH